MQIESLNNLYLKEYQSQKNKIDRNADPTSSNNGRVSLSDDQKVNIEISQTGRNLSEQLKSLKGVMAKLRTVDDVRQWKIDEVKDKIANGFYDSKNIHDLVAEKITSLVIS